MYSVRNLLDKNPIQITVAVMAAVNLVMILGLQPPNAEHSIPALETLLVSALGLFVSTRTTNSSDLADVIDAELPPEPENVAPDRPLVARAVGDFD